MRGLLMRASTRRRAWALGLALPPMALLGLGLLAPVVSLMGVGLAGRATDGIVWQAGPGLGWAALLADEHLRFRLVWSLVQAALTCALALLAGVPLAWCLARFQFRGRRWVLRALMLPFVVPTLVAALGVLALWGPGGWPGAWLHERGWFSGEGPWLLLYGNLFFNLCLVVRAGVDAFGQVGAAQVAAARTLGASPWRVFWRVEWPAALPWLASALCLVFLYCLSGFGLALVLGGPRYATVEVEIYSLVAHELDLETAGRLALVMLLLNACVALGYAWLERRLAAPARAVPLAPRPPKGWREHLLLGASLTLWVFVCVAPLGAIVLRAVWALVGGGGLEMLQAPATWQALTNTLRFSAIALLLATLLGMAHAWSAQVLRGGVWAVGWRAAAYLPFVVSPVTVAFGLLLIYPEWSASLGLLLMAYVALAYPFVAKSLAAALDRLPASYAQAAATLGASPWRVFRRVTLPLVWPAMRRGMAFAAATTLGEFAVTLFLSRPEWTTLTTLIHQQLGRAGGSRLDGAMVLAGLLMVMTLWVFVCLDPRAGDEEPDRART